MNRHGVHIMAGTDVGNPYLVAGFSLHHELQLLVDAGLSPMEALQTATRNPAIFLGLQDRLGTIEKGKRADLVLLDANPLDQISNIDRIAGVVLGGQWLPRQQLDSMLSDAQKVADSN